MKITPFRIDVPQAEIDDLHQRLDRTRFADDLPGVGWSLGVPAVWLRETVAYWRNDYDWRAWEARLNGIPQFTTEIDGQDIHFIHVPSPVADATPLVLLHGWPGSIVEFLDLIGPLTDPAAHGGDPADAFHVVIPSHPGFGFSGPTVETGWTTKRMARAMATLMADLGYERYLAQGGDIGALIGPELTTEDPEHVMGVHVNAATWGFIPWSEPSDEERAELTAAERGRLDRLKHWETEGSGYFQIQSTRPQTIGALLADSPTGQLAWIMDFFHASSERAEGSDEIPIDRDLLLTDVMLYWLTNTGTSSARAYWEAMHDNQDWAEAEADQGWGEAIEAEEETEATEDWTAATSTVPVGVAVFARDVAIRRYAEQMYTIVHWAEFDRGGHFAALEAPDLLIGDIRAFARKVR